MRGGGGISQGQAAAGTGHQGRKPQPKSASGALIHRQVSCIPVQETHPNTADPPISYKISPCQTKLEMPRFGCAGGVDFDDWLALA